jgi:hypothetical protein
MFGTINYSVLNHIALAILISRQQPSNSELLHLYDLQVLPDESQQYSKGNLHI